MLKLEQERARYFPTKAPFARLCGLTDSNYGLVERGVRPPYAPERQRIVSALRSLGWRGNGEELFEVVTDDARD